MLIIGEKINGTRPIVAQAIARRDAEVIQSLAVRQANTGADWLDINAGTPPHREPEDLCWLVETVQKVVDIPLCLDSANPEALTAAMRKVAKTPMINSVSGELKRLERVLPIVAACAGRVIALLLDSDGVPGTVDGRLRVAERILESAHAAGIPNERIFLDPITLTIASQIEGARVTLDAIRAIKTEFPQVKTCIGLSNVSYGLPHRSRLNQAYLAIALSAGVEAAILDPLDGGVRSTLLAAMAVVGQDKFGVKYIRVVRRQGV